MKDAVIKWAASQIGYAESPPGSNRVKYWDDYGLGWQGQPWCVAFQWWCFQKADESMAFFAGAKTASCGELLQYYRKQGMVVPIDEVQPGDLAFESFRGGSAPEHIGIVESVISGPVLQVVTIEGNTSPGLGMEGSQDNGGCVARKIRYRSQIVAVARPKYKEAEMDLEDQVDYEDHWAAADIDWCIVNGLLKGYPDGDFKPDKPVTRAEMAVIIRRVCKYVKGG